MTRLEQIQDRMKDKEPKTQDEKDIAFLLWMVTQLIGLAQVKHG